MRRYTMEDIKEELDCALKMLGTILLSGDAVDVMAAAKQKIRKAISMLPPDKEGDSV